jgi:hypothetical protein
MLKFYNNNLLPVAQVLCSKYKSGCASQFQNGRRPYLLAPRLAKRGVELTTIWPVPIQSTEAGATRCGLMHHV